MPNTADRKIYIKDESFDPIYRPVNQPFLLRSRLLPGIFLLLGVVVFVSQIIVPIYFFETQEVIPQEINTTMAARAAGFYKFEFTELSKIKPDGAASPLTQNTNIPEYFYVTIPKLGIERAHAKTNSEDLSPSTYLGHYKGSAVPGEPGNAFIYGHSVLPIFYNPKNYKSIFSTLGKLVPGDEITIEVNNKKLVYKVEGKENLKPELVDPLQNFKPGYLKESTLILMTCTPPGTKLERLLVKAVLVNN